MLRAYGSGAQTGAWHTERRGRQLGALVVGAYVNVYRVTPVGRCNRQLAWAHEILRR